MDTDRRLLAEFLVRELDRANRWAERAKALPVMSAKYEGEANGLTNALAYMAGQRHEFRVETFIATIRREGPPDLRAPEGEARALDGNR